MATQEQRIAQLEEDVRTLSARVRELDQYVDGQLDKEEAASDADLTARVDQLADTVFGTNVRPALPEKDEE